MSEIRYIAFPVGKQPTVDEAAELKNLYGVLGGRVAIGVNRKSRWLAIAFDAEYFERARRKHRGFADLVRRWETRGAEVLDRLSFAKDPSALRPSSPDAWTPPDPETGIDVGDRHLAEKELAAKEAVGRSLLAVQQTLDRYSALQRFGQSFPYLLMGVGTLVLLLTAYYIGDRLSNAKAEKRKETTERFSSDGMHEALTLESGSAVEE